MEINTHGQVKLSEEEIFEGLYSGKIKDLKDIFTDEHTSQKFNSSTKNNQDSFSFLKILPTHVESIKSFDQTNQSEWFMPDEYKNIDIEGLIFYLCPKENYDRVHKEIVLFRKNNMIDLLKYLKFLVDTMKQNNIVWGVGRGSCVASYTLFLLGVHKIDSIKYNLDMQEFFKEGENNDQI